MVMGVCAASEVNNWTVFDSLDLTSQQQQEKGLLGRTDRGPTKMKNTDYLFEQLKISARQAMKQNIGSIVDHTKDLN